MRQSGFFLAQQDRAPLARLWAFVTTWLLAISLGANYSPVLANPYLAKPGERSTHIRIATCAVSGGFAHLYTALENRLFDKYGFQDGACFYPRQRRLAGGANGGRDSISLLRRGRDACRRWWPAST